MHRLCIYPEYSPEILVAELQQLLAGTHAKLLQAAVHDRLDVLGAFLQFRLNLLHVSEKGSRAHGVSADNVFEFWIHVQAFIDADIWLGFAILDRSLHEGLSCPAGSL